MKLFTPAAVAALEAGTFARRQLIWVEMPDEPVGFWGDAYDAVIEGRTYLATYGAIRMTPFSSGSDFGVRNLTITLPGLDVRVQQRVLDQPYHQRPIYATEALISPETQQILDLTQWFGGIIDRIPRRERLGGTSVLDVQCEGYGRDLSRSGARTRSDADQRQLDSSDRFFDQVVPANNVPLIWGRQEQPKQKSSSWLDKIF